MTTMAVASLGMYDLPALRKANDALWGGVAGWLRDHGVDRVPERLDRERTLARIWDDPELLLAQTCGLPFATRWRDQLRYVATPVYDVPGCEGPWYRSVLVVARDSGASQLGELRGSTVAINEASSNSGCNLLAMAVESLVAPADREPFFAAALLTGSHLASAQAVADGGAGVAAIDVVTYAHIGSHHPDLTHRLRPIGRTPVAPGLPLVTATKSSSSLVSILQQALAWASQAEELRAARQVLRLKGFAQVPLADYTALSPFTGADLDAVPALLARHVVPAQPTTVTTGRSQGAPASDNASRACGR